MLVVALERDGLRPAISPQDTLHELRPLLMIKLDYGTSEEDMDREWERVGGARARERERERDSKM